MRNLVFRPLAAALALIALPLAGCSGTGSRDPRAPGLGADEAVVSLVDVKSFQERFTIVRASHEAPASGEGGEVDGVIAGHRVTVSSSDPSAEVTVADQDAAAEIVAMTASARGWLVLARDGGIYRAKSFLAPLERVADLPAPPRVWATGGRLSVIDTSGTLWLVDEGAREARRAKLIERALDAAFGDAAHGVAVVEGGALYRTSDGGATWTAAALGTDAARAVQARGDHVYIELASGMRVLGADGSLAPATMPEPEPFPRLAAPVREAIDVAVLKHAEAHLDGRAAADGTISALHYHAGSTFGEVPPDLVTYGARGQTWRSTRETGGATLHSLSPWGSAIGGLAQPAPGAGLKSWALFRSRDGGAFERYAAGPESEDSIVFSDDGAHAAWPHACATPPSVTVTSQQPGMASGTFTFSATSDSACVVSGPGDAGRTVTLSPPAARLLGMHAGALLYVTAHETLRVLADGGAANRLVARATRSGKTAPAVTGASFGSDGTVAATFGEGATFTAVLATPAGPIRTVAVPAPARMVAFADATHGMAAGRTAADVWRTADGGAHWEAVPSPVEGAAASVSLEPWIRCAAFGCEVGGHLRVRGWGAFRKESRLPVANRSGGAIAPAATPFMPPLEELVCKRTSTPADAREANASPAPESGRTETLAADGVVAVLQHEGVGAAVTWAVQWKGRDADGDYQARMVASPVPQGESSTSTLILRGASRRGLLLARCEENAGFEGCPLVYASATHGVRELPFGEAGNAFVSSRQKMSLVGSAPLPGGDLLVALYEVGDDADSGLRAGPTYDRVVRLGSNGAIVGERDFVWSTPSFAKPADHPGDPRVTLTTIRLRGLATFRGVVGLAVGDMAPSHRLRFYPLQNDLAAAPVDGPDFALGAHVACSGAAPADALDLWVPSSLGLDLLVDPGDGSARAGSRALLEVAPGHGNAASVACIRRIESSIDTPADSRQERWHGDGLELDASGTGFVGATRTWSGRTEVRCDDVKPVNLFGP